MVLKRFRDRSDRLNATKTKHMKKKTPKKRSEKHYARTTNDNSFRNKAGCQIAVAGLGEALWITFAI